jgi:hypothetical protein
MIYRLLTLLLLAIPQATTFSVSGTVVREDKLDPATAPQANQIRISGPSTSIIGIGAGGAFRFPNLRPGTYQIVVGPRITMAPVTIVVTDKDLTDLRIVVPQTLEIAGTISVEGNGPRPRFQLAFTRVDAAGQNPVITATGATFRLPVAAGEYRVAANALPAGYTLKSALMGGKDVLNQTFTIAAGSQPEIAFTLGVASPPPWVRVRGRVIGGKATSVSLTGTPMAETPTAVIGATGEFEFPMVLPGNYLARILPAIPALAPESVTVGATDIANLELRLPPMKEVAGKVTIRGNVAAPRLIFTVAGGPAAASNPASTITVLQGVVVTTAAGTAQLPTTISPDGSFRITLPEGERTLSIVPSSLPQGFSVDTFTYGTQNLLADPIRVARNDTAELAITIDATTVKPRNVRGRVTGLLDTRGVRVVLQGGSLGPGVESPVAPDGTFAFNDILPGNYSARLSLSGHVVTTAVTVGNNDVTNVVINHPRRFSIAAQILVEGDSADPPSIPAILLEALGPAGAVVTATASSTNPSPVVLTVSDGDHRISVRNLPAGYVLKSIRYGNVDLQESPLTVDGPITWEIIVRLTKTGA